MNKTEEVRVPVFLTYEEFAALLTGLQSDIAYCDDELEKGITNPNFWLEEREKRERSLEEHYRVFTHYEKSKMWRVDGDG